MRWKVLTEWSSLVFNLNVEWDSGVSSPADSSRWRMRMKLDFFIEFLGSFSNQVSVVKYFMGNWSKKALK